jgi:hypothetical protein
MPVKGCKETLRTSAGTKSVACEEGMARLMKAMRGCARIWSVLHLMLFVYHQYKGYVYAALSPAASP